MTIRLVFLTYRSLALMVSPQIVMMYLVCFLMVVSQLEEQGQHNPDQRFCDLLPGRIVQSPGLYIQHFVAPLLKETAGKVM